MIDLKDFESIDDIVAQILAREIAYSFEMARSVGYKMPTDYDVGFRRVAVAMFHGPQGERYRYRLRVDDATHDVSVLIPYLDNRNSLVDVDRLWKAAIQDLIRGACTMAHVWIDKHPEVNLGRDGAREALAKLNVVRSDNAKEAGWAAEVRKRAQQQTFTKVR